MYACFVYGIGNPIEFPKERYHTAIKILEPSYCNRLVQGLFTETTAISKNKFRARVKCRYISSYTDHALDSFFGDEIEALNLRSI
jgi:hypothetical protein